MYTESSQLLIFFCFKLHSSSRYFHFHSKSCWGFPSICNFRLQLSNFSLASFRAISNVYIVWGKIWQPTYKVLVDNTRCSSSLHPSGIPSTHCTPSICTSHTKLSSNHYRLFSSKKRTHSKTVSGQKSEKEYPTFCKVLLYLLLTASTAPRSFLHTVFNI